MLIEYVDIQNFRKLRSVRIEFSPQSTLFVGANNSGKTSAMVALRYFLCRGGANAFSTNDFTLSHWEALNSFGKEWIQAIPESNSKLPDEAKLTELLPSLDVWIRVRDSELHYARDLLPTLDWTGGLLGVRLLFEPKDTESLMRDFFLSYSEAETVTGNAKSKEATSEDTLHTLWPRDFQEFLSRKLSTYFTVKAYLLDPAKQLEPHAGEAANPQELPIGSEPVEGNPIEKLVQVDEIAAQRGLGETNENAEDGDSLARRGTRKLSSQLSAYYKRHLDPTDYPEPKDLEALEAIAQAEKLFDERLATSFSKPLDELKQLNYPGVTDPKLKIATRVRPTDGLNHPTAVQYEAFQSKEGETSSSFTLPEDYNGLGYQNLISIVFRLLGFRDAWMRVGKVAKAIEAQGKKASASPPPLHLVLVEEPEAHLHAQVQQVFVRQAYGVLRNHKALGDDETLSTQLVVSTHSSHVAHESDFANLRYFRRLPATAGCPIPTSVVRNLSEVFGSECETGMFVSRYLRANHCDLLFADAAILVEGTAERMLIPHFIKSHFQNLHRCYVTLLEIGGSHAHRLRPLIEHLGLTTLIITDLDSLSGESPHQAIPPKRNAGQLTGNPTLKEWIPEKKAVDELLGLSFEKKLRTDSKMPNYSVRVAYQTPIETNLDGKGAKFEMLATTFEDALVLENTTVFRNLEGTGMVGKFAEFLKASNPEELGKKIFQAVRNGDKGAFALDVLFLIDPLALCVPSYIKEGLGWLETELVPTEREANKKVLRGS